ncbi:MAG: peptidyl-prolyl cis-trans isomerase [Chloroflexi bacterium]|nr:peptidyl-prolyl cis-trans isomerase [Chloroflexota bacterium]
MPEGWKQVLQDLRNALRSDAPLEEKPSTRDGPDAAEAAEAASHPERDPNAAAEMHADGGTGAAIQGDQVAADAPASSVPTPESPTMPGEAASAAKAQPGPWQASVIVGVLAVAAIIVAAWPMGLGELWAQLTAPKPPTPDVVAVYNGGQITVADFEAHLKALAPQAYTETVRSLSTLRALAREMVADEVARRWAIDQKKDADKNFQHTMEHITEEINLDTFTKQLHNGQIDIPESEIQSYFEANRTEFISQTLTAVREDIRRRLVEERESKYVSDYLSRLKSNASVTRNDDLLNVPEPMANDIRAYYDANRRTYTVTARFTIDLLTVPVTGREQDAKATAEKALLRLRSGADFAAVAREITGTQVITGIEVMPGTEGAAWDTAVSALKPGELSGVLRSHNAFDIVRAVKMELERLQTFEEASPAVEAIVRQKKLDEWMQANGAKTLFTIKNQRYTLGQFYDEYKEFPPETRARFSGKDGFKRLADALIDRLVLVEDTYDQLLQEKNKAAIDQTRLDILKQMLEQQEVDDKIVITDADINQYYEQNKERMALPPRVRIRYIRVGLGNSEDEQKAARAKADEAYKRLSPGLLQQSADFAAVAKEYSEDPDTAANGGELPNWIGESGPFEAPDLHALHEAALALPINGVSQPIPVGDSLYIIQPIERTEPQTLSLDEAKSYIRETLTDEKHRELSAQLQETLAKQINAVFYDSALEAYIKSTGVPLNSESKE